MSEEPKLELSDLLRYLAMHETIPAVDAHVCAKQTQALLLLEYSKIILPQILWKHNPKKAEDCHKVVEITCAIAYGMTTYTMGMAKGGNQ